MVVPGGVSWGLRKDGGRRTGPSRSGIMTTSRPTLKRIHMNPRRVTMFGATHSGSSSTKAFHYSISACVPIALALAHLEKPGGRGRGSAYVWPQDVVGYRGLVDSRVLVGLEVDQGVVRDALGDCFFCGVDAATVSTGSEVEVGELGLRQGKSKSPVQDGGKGGAGSLRTAVVDGEESHGRGAVSRCRQPPTLKGMRWWCMIDSKVPGVG